MKIVYVFKDNKKLISNYDVSSGNMSCSNKCYSFKNKCDYKAKKSCEVFFKNIISVLMGAYNNSIEVSDLCEGISTIEVREIKK